MALTPSRPRDRDDVRIAIICALPLEAEMVYSVFDKDWADEDIDLGQSEGDQNAYAIGVIEERNVVLAHMPGIGGGNAAAVVTGLCSSYRRIDVAFLVGTCGVTPKHPVTKADIVLGDCVISTAVIHYDYRRQFSGLFGRMTGIEDTLGKASLSIRASIAKMQTAPNLNHLSSELQHHLGALQKEVSNLQYPGCLADRLFKESYIHEHRGGANKCDQCEKDSGVCKQDCSVLGCNDSELVKRDRFQSNSDQNLAIHPQLHFGPYGSTNTVLKSGKDRERLVKRDGIVAFGMEAPGVQNNLSTIVVKSACDYADSHKNKNWQRYAAATAAAGLKSILGLWRVLDITQESDPVIHDMNASFAEIEATFKADALIRDYYCTGDRLLIERLSGEQLSLEKCYINLPLIDRLGETRKEEQKISFSLESRLPLNAPEVGQGMSLENLFKPRKLADGKTIHPRRIFIQGRAGIGKTTLCKKLVYEFLQGQLGSNLFDRLLWIPVRRLRPIQEYGWHELLRDTFRMSNHTWKEVQNMYGKQFDSSVFLGRTLFLLDGLDEIPHRLKDEDSLYHFLNTIICSAPNVIITSRPQVNTFGLGSFDLDLETIGFTVDQVSTYIENYVADSSTVLKMKRIVAHEPLIQGLLRIPIQLDAFCCTWHEERTFKVALPEIITSSSVTMTKLYQDITIELCKKDLARLGRLNQRQQLSLSEIQDELKGELTFLEEIAFCGLLDNVVEFNSQYWERFRGYSHRTSAEFSTIFSSTFDRLSFVRTSGHNDYTERTYHFIHLTYQEFFAARHFAKHWQHNEPLAYLRLTGRDKPDSQTPLAFLHEKKYDGRYNIFWRFVVGLTSGKHDAIADAISGINETYTDSDYASNNIGLEHSGRDDAQDETNTIVSFASFPEAERLEYQHVFTSELLKAVNLEFPDARLLDDVTRSLPGLLKIFALKLGHDAKQGREYDAMFFTLKYPAEIIETFQDRWRDIGKVTAKAHSDEMSLQERVMSWQISENCDPVAEVVFKAEDPRTTDPTPIQLRANPELEVDDIQQASVPSANLDFVTTTPAYAWLVSRLVQLRILNFPDTSVMTTIRRIVESRYPLPHKISRKTSPMTHTMTFNLEWQLAHFLQSYQFGDSQDIATIMHTFVTLTSDGSHVQALTAVQYLRQTWPENGELVLTFIIAIVQQNQATASFSEGTAEGRLLGSNITVKITGTSFLITDIAEQLAWLGAAFRPSPEEGLVYDCKVSINVMTERTADNYSCTMRFKDTPARGDSATCWHNLFKYAVVAQGFPIAKRANSINGLEMTLGTMLAFCHARYIGKFNNNITIKGFSNIFSLSERGSDGCLWHLHRNADGSYISYRETGKGSQNQDIEVHEILQDRHFVGWCSQSVYGAGATNSNYQIQRSCLPFAHSGCYLHRKSLRRGHNYPPDIICIANSKRFPNPTTAQNFHDKMHQMHNHPVVLWDTDRRRGWLTNGTSALLHLVFASMEKGDSLFTSGYCLRKEDLIQDKHNTEYAAADILLREDNLNMVIRLHLNEPLRLRDRIEDIYFLLNFMMEEQITAFKDRDITPTALEGWDFVDLANTATKVLQPRVFVPDKDCKGWMTLLKDTRAVTLFGNDFGEIYRPVSSALCAHWSTLPSYKCYLAACGDDLKMIMQEHNGNNKAVPQRLTQNTTWPVLRRTFEDCSCSPAVQQHSDLVQVLVPNSIFMPIPDMENALRETPNKGAVIFGESQDSAWLQPDEHAESSRRPFKRLRAESSSGGAHDSGLGDSISSVLTLDSLESPNYTEYLVAIVCALPKELLAVRHLFDQEYADPVFDKHDKSSYAFGRILSHKIVAACLPARYGGCLATNVATELRRSFPTVKICLLVGIGGGIPSSENDIRLGDVVVSYPSKNHCGIVKYDFEKVRQNGDSEPLGSFKPPPEELLRTIGILQSDPKVKDGLLQPYIESIAEANPKYLHPGTENDTLYVADHSHHPKAPACNSYNAYVIQREPRKSNQPRIHYGLIASGDKIIKDAHLRDEIGKRYEALCIEMEAAGIAGIFDSLVIRGICDYADSHKNDKWQEYASATAAAYAKLLLGKMRPLPGF